MKKSTKTIALLTALVLVTACFIGGTIARYITSTSSEDEARVAVWGINEAGTTMNLFKNAYTIDEGGALKAKSANETEDIIAPGLNGASQFKIVNTSTLKPEVMYEIAINLDDSEIADEIKNHPGIEWKVDDGNWGTWEEFKTSLLSLSGDSSGVKTYAPLDVEHEFANGKTHTVAWQWIMDSGYDAEDTAMGNYAATTDDITAKLSITVTARQVNEDTTGLLNGSGQIYSLSSPNTTLSFRSAAPFDEFSSVKVNGTELTKDVDYTVASGSTIVTLKSSYLSNLETGSFKIEIISQNATVSTTFEVVAGVATVNGVGYSTLQEAINSIKTKSTVKLMANVTESVTIAENQNIILDLNGHNITGKYKDGTNLKAHEIADEYSAIINEGTLTLTGKGTVASKTDGTPALFNKGTATLLGGTYTRTIDDCTDPNATYSDGTVNSYYSVVNIGTMTIDDKSVLVTSKSIRASAFANGWNSSSYDLQTIYGYREGTLIVNAGTITGGRHAITNNFGTTTINGGFIVANSKGKDAIGIDNDTLTINGGEIFSSTGLAISADSNTEIIINAGKISGKINADNTVSITDNRENGANLEESSWEEVTEIIKAGKAKEYYSLGAIKTVNIDGVDYETKIIGFDHDGDNTVTFMFNEKIENNKMNAEGTNSGSWKNSKMRTEILPRILNGMENKDCIKEITKTTIKGYADGHSNNTTNILETTKDKLFLVSYSEVHGSSFAVTEQGKQYEYFKNGGYVGNLLEIIDEGYLMGYYNSLYYWLRNPSGEDSSCFYKEERDDTQDIVPLSPANSTYNVVPAFVIG